MRVKYYSIMLQKTFLVQDMKNTSRADKLPPFWPNGQSHSNLFRKSRSPAACSERTLKKDIVIRVS